MDINGDGRFDSLDLSLLSSMDEDNNGGGGGGNRGGGGSGCLTTVIAIGIGLAIISEIVG